MTLSNEALIEYLLLGQDLEASLMRELFERIFAGQLPPAQIAATLALLRAKGESAQEIYAAADVILRHAQHIERPDYLFGDIVGTGGDGHNSINVSTLASITAASMGLPVAKHGNQSVSSKCGSADLLRSWQIDINMSPERARASLDELGFCFLLAPHYHPSFRAVRELRNELKIRTIFNIIGPLVNPLKPPVMLVGVYAPYLLMPFALALKSLGRKRALVVHGSGLDEIALHGPTRAVLVDDQNLHEFEFEPKTMGLSMFALEDIQGQSIADNSELGLAILRGDADEAKTSVVAASAGVLLWLAGKAPDFVQGIKEAREALRSGIAFNTYKKLQEFSKHGS